MVRGETSFDCGKVGLRLGSAGAVEEEVEDEDEEEAGIDREGTTNGRFGFRFEFEPIVAHDVRGTFVGFVEERGSRVDERRGGSCGGGRERESVGETGETEGSIV